MATFCLHVDVKDSTLVSAHLNHVYLPVQLCIITPLLSLLHFAIHKFAPSWWNVVTSDMILLQLWLCPFWAKVLII